MSIALYSESRSRLADIFFPIVRILWDLCVVWPIKVYAIQRMHIIAMYPRYFSLPKDVGVPFSAR